MEKLLSSIEKYILLSTLFLMGVFITFGNSSPFVIPKEVVLVTGTSLIVLVWVAKMFVNGALTIKMGKFDLGILLLAATYLIATFVATPNKMEAYLLPGTTTFIVAGAVLYFLINQFDKNTKHLAKIALFASAVVISFTSILATLRVFERIPQLPAIVKDPAFNLLGGAVPSMIFLMVSLVFGAALLLKEKNSSKKTMYGIALGVILFGLSILVFSAMPGRPTSPRFASMQDSWEVAIDTLKKSPLVGVGPANYLTAFSLFKPLTYNQTDLWQVRFTTGSNFYFTLLTETGFLGLFAIAVLLISLYKFVRRDFKWSSETEKLTTNLEKISLVIMVLLFVILPITPVVMVYFFVMLALFSESEHKSIHLNIAANDSSSMVSSRIPVIIVGLPFVAAVLYLAVTGFKVLRAEATFAKSLNALANNDAKTTYDLMTTAINQNPRVDRYHASFAQVNLAVASSIAQKQDITENDRGTITRLVQQAISEGKATVALNPQRSGNWEVLAQTYRSIMSFAQGADQFAVQTYTQAIALDPTNPNLRIALGGIYYSLGNYDAAIDTFKLAIVAKPDLANSHYNLAIAYREKKDYDNAIAEIKNVMALVQSGSEDYNLAEKTLADLESKKTSSKAPAGSTENLTPPQPQEPSNVNPPITLPEEANPPASPAPAP